MLMWALTLASVFVCYFLSLRYKARKKVFLIFSGILIVAIMGSRYFINGFTDEITYNYEYQGYMRWSLDRVLRKITDSRDWGFTFTYWLLAKVFPWEQFPIYFITAFFIFASFRFIYYNVEEPLIAVLLILSFDIFTFYMAGYRQCFAMCFCLFAFEFAKKQKLLPYLLLVLVAITMHLSSVIFVPVYLFVNIKQGERGQLFWLISFVTMIILSEFLMQQAVEIFDRESYVERREFSLVGFSIQIIIMLIPLILYTARYAIVEKEVDYSLIGLMIIGVIFYSLKLSNFSYERLSYYYTFFVVGAFSNAVASLKGNKTDNTVAITKVIICAVFVLLAFWRNPGNLQFFWMV